MLKKKEKTGYSEMAVAAFITSGLLGIFPLFDLDMSIMQATNLGLFAAAFVGWIVRQAWKDIKS